MQRRHGGLRRRHYSPQHAIYSKRLVRRFNSFPVVLPFYLPKIDVYIHAVLLTCSQKLSHSFSSCHEKLTLVLKLTTYKNWCTKHETPVRRNHIMVVHFVIFQLNFLRAVNKPKCNINSFPVRYLAGTYIMLANKTNTAGYLNESLGYLA